MYLAQYYFNMNSDIVNSQEFLTAAKKFVKISDELSSGWKIHENKGDPNRTFIKKETFIEIDEKLLKAEFIIFYNLNYGVPSFSFNIWNSSGVLLSLEEIRNMTFIQINKEEFYSVVTQQEHPLFFRPYFMVHPCHTNTLLANFKNKSKNIIITFLGLITPLLNINLPLEFGL